MNYLPHKPCSAETYFPDRGDWQRAHPHELGLDSDTLAMAIDYQRQHESTWPRDFLTSSGRYIGVADEPEHADDVLGPVQARSGPNGLVLRHGLIAAEWGDTSAVDMSFSVAKSYLAAVAGVAVDSGLIRNLDDRVADYAVDDGFRSEHNRAISWRHLLQQTSEWHGSLWGRSDFLINNRVAGLSVGDTRTPLTPGARWEYNDVRVNRLSLSLLQLFQRPLPTVLRETIMDPIGASAMWSWQHYRRSMVSIASTLMPSVPGGSHWGGGLFMSSLDHARFALLIARRGRWGATQLLSDSWITTMLTPQPLNGEYGLLWWLNAQATQLPSAPLASYMAWGGPNLLWIDPDDDLVVVARWIEKTAADGFVRLVLSALR
jgi:hypothetical protein